MKKKGFKVQRKRKRSGFFFTLIILVAVFVLIQTPTIKKVLYPYPYRSQIEEYAVQYEVDPLLVISVIRAESKFLPYSESHKGALGLMQLMPDTAKWIAETLGDQSFSESQLKEPAKNIQYGTWYIANLQKEFRDIELVLAAYNGGRGHVNEWLKTEQLKLDELKTEDIPFGETREYVQRVLENYANYKELYGLERTR
ncbi:lytic transglycosylase domain-containing protein [Desulfitobacterium sp. THU1]|uniref:lytic transglycosylase domain-containing protein n=1 Tax=Desulfitobacterium sp. THU1 TaxID=3138072 RepID=UPI00311F2D3D